MVIRHDLLLGSGGLPSQSGKKLVVMVGVVTYRWQGADLTPERLLCMSPE